jgi:hypothetical protein
MRNICSSRVQGDQNEKEKKPFIHKRAYERLLCNLKPNNHILVNGLYLLSSLAWMKKVTAKVFKIITLLKIHSKFNLV